MWKRLSIHPDRVLYLYNGEPIYYGRHRRLKQVFDYGRNNCPPTWYWKLARKDPFPAITPPNRPGDTAAVCRSSTSASATNPNCPTFCTTCISTSTLAM